MLWRVLTTPGVATNTGFGPPQLNRSEILRRISGNVPDWVADDLLDSYEVALLKALSEKEKKKSTIGPRDTRRKKD